MKTLQPPTKCNREKINKTVGAVNEEEALQSGTMNKLLWIVSAIAATLAIAGLALLASHKSIIRSKVIQEVVFTNGSEAFENWQRPPIPILFKVWIYNITNSEEFKQNTSTVLTFNEVGPYVYQEKKEKGIIDETQDEITYAPKSSFKFRSDLSGNLSIDDKFTTLNIPVLTLLGFDEKSQNIGEKKFKFLSAWITGYLKNLMVAEKDTIITKTVDELVLGGYKPEIFARSEKLSKNFGTKMPDLFAIILERNGTNFAGNWTVGTGVSDPSKLATLISINNQTSNPVWQNDTPCSEWRGTDGQQFASGLTQSSTLKVFVPDFCRDFSFTPVGEGVINGVDGITFKLNQIYSSQRSEDTCYCMKDNVTDCHGDGLMDIASCRYGSHIVISQPHFHNVNDDIINVANNVTEANESRDSSHLNIEPWTGAPLAISFKLQINFDLQSYPLYGRNHTQQIVPLVWFEQYASVDDSAVNQLKSLLLNKITIIRVIAGVAIALGLPVILGVAVHIYLSKKKRGIA